MAEIKFIQHIPNSCSGVEPKEYEVSNKEELLDLDVVKQWKHGHDVPFYRYSQGKIGERYVLMVEYKNENEHTWWVVGYLSEGVGLPEFSSEKV